MRLKLQKETLKSLNSTGATGGKRALLSPDLRQIEGGQVTWGCQEVQLEPFLSPDPLLERVGEILARPLPKVGSDPCGGGFPVCGP